MRNRTETSLPWVPGYYELARRRSMHRLPRFEFLSVLRPARRLCSLPGSVSIDTSGLGPLGRRVRAPTHREFAPGLLRELSHQIRFRGPLSVAEFMSMALTHPVHGYYMRRDVFGQRGDFVTSPEICQVFGELLGVWCVACWEQLGRPERLHLVEAGPGRGTLMADVLRSTAPFGDFQRALSVHLLEVSPFMRSAQREALLSCDARHGGAQRQRSELPTDGETELGDQLMISLPGSPAQPTEVRWHSDLNAMLELTGEDSSGATPTGETPAGEAGATHGEAPLLLIGHEFLDALPVHQFVRTPSGWRERLVDLRVHEESLHIESLHEEATSATGGHESGSKGAEGGLRGMPLGASSGVAEEGEGRDAPRDLDEDPRELRFVLAAGDTPASRLLSVGLPPHLDQADFLCKCLTRPIWADLGFSEPSGVPFDPFAPLSGDCVRLIHPGGTVGRCARIRAATRCSTHST